MAFGGGILGGVHKIWGNPYLNSTTVLFDNVAIGKLAPNNIIIVHLQIQFMIVNIYGWIKGKKYNMLVLSISIMAVHMFYSTQIESNDLKTQNGFLKNEVQLLNNTLRNKIYVIQNQQQKLMEQTEQIEKFENDRDVITGQIRYINKWMVPIKELENHVQYVVEYCDLKKQQSEFYFSPEDQERMAVLHRKIGYSLDEDDDSIIVPKAIELIIKFRKECDKFMSALSSMDFDKMRALQAYTNTDRIKDMMEDFTREVLKLKSLKRKFKRSNDHMHDSATHSTDTGLQTRGLFSTIGSVLDSFGSWLWGKLNFWS